MELTTDQKIHQVMTYVKSQEERFQTEITSLQKQLTDQAAFFSQIEANLVSRIEQLESLVFAGIAGSSTPMESTHEAKQDGDLGGSIFRTRSDAELPQSFDVPEEDIVRFAVQILEQHGSLPIGKMGSLLHRVANNHRLPTILKERYGGLKRFLQQYPDTFALANDHPYNPHVYILKGPRVDFDMTFSDPINEPTPHHSYPPHQQSSQSASFIPQFQLTPPSAGPPPIDRALSHNTAMAAASTSYPNPHAFRVESDVFNLFPPVPHRPHSFTR